MRATPTNTAVSMTALNHQIPFRACNPFSMLAKWKHAIAAAIRMKLVSCSTVQEVEDVLYGELLGGKK